MKKKPVGIAVPGRMTKKKKPTTKRDPATAKRAQRATSGGSGMAAGISKARRKVTANNPEAQMRLSARDSARRNANAKKQPAKPKRKPRKNSPLMGGPMPRPKRRS